eukprot:CCRYP_002166-RC/>CCRYP_002166-RC protein AED:0.06 eAED:0.06 QI:149/1/1/1/1/1/5/736/887
MKPTMSTPADDNSSFDSGQLESDSDDQESSSSGEDTHSDECDICGDGGELICCDGCEKAYHAKCLSLSADVLPEVWYGPCCEGRLSIKRKSPVCSSANKDPDLTKDENNVDGSDRGREEGRRLVPAGGESTSNKSSQDENEVRDTAKDHVVETAPSIGQVTEKRVIEQSVVQRSQDLQLQSHQRASNLDANLGFTHNTKHATIGPSSVANKDIHSQQYKQSSFSLTAPQQLKGSYSSVLNIKLCDKCNRFHTQYPVCPYAKIVQQGQHHRSTATSTNIHDASSSKTNQKPPKQSTFRAVVVPPGVAEGSIFHVVMENAQTIGVICPKGVQPRQTMIVLEPGVDVAPIPPKTIVEMNESRLVAGFNRREAEYVRRAFWDVLFPHLEESGWSFTREINYNFGAYRFASPGNSSGKNGEFMETIAQILKFVESNGCCPEQVQEFHRCIEKQKEDDRRGSDRKRKRAQDAVSSNEMEHIRIGGKYQVRSLPRSGSNAPASSKQYIQEQIWSREEAPPEAYSFLNSLPHRCREEAFCAMHTVGYDPRAEAPSHIIDTNKEKIKWNECAEDPSFEVDFHNAMMQCKKELRDVSSTLKRPIGFCLWYYYSKYKPSKYYAALKNHMKEQQSQEGRNRDECTICEEGGELLCCDTCSNAYHLKCLGVSNPNAFDDEESWACPDCIRKRTESCRSPAKSPSKVRSIDKSPKKLSFTENDTNIRAQYRKPFESEYSMPQPMNLHQISLPADLLKMGTGLVEEARNSDNPAEADASHGGFSKGLAAKGHMNHIQNASPLFTTGADNMSFQCGVFSSQCYTLGRTEEEPKTKYDYGDRYSLQNVSARKQGDGTVLPIFLKRLPNGEYARPIGRQRKGMHWDGVRGLWVPIPSEGIPGEKS